MPGAGSRRPCRGEAAIRHEEVTQHLLTHSGPFLFVCARLNTGHVSIRSATEPEGCGGARDVRRLFGECQDNGSGIGRRFGHGQGRDAHDSAMLNRHASCAVEEVTSPIYPSARVGYIIVPLRHRTLVGRRRCPGRCGLAAEQARHLPPACACVGTAPCRQMVRRRRCRSPRPRPDEAVARTVGCRITLR